MSCRPKNTIVACLLVLTIFWGQDLLAQNQKAIELTTGSWQPYTHESASNLGVAAHIVTEAFARVGMTVEYEFLPWTRAIKLARDGKRDGSIIWYETEERREAFYYSDPVLNATNVFFHLTDHSFNWEKFEDLSNFRVGGTAEYSYGQNFDNAEKQGVFTTSRAISDEAGLTNLLKGRIDVFPGELLVTYTQIRDTFPASDARLFTHHPKFINEIPLYVLFSKKVAGMEGVRDEFNLGLKSLKESGRYDQIVSTGLIFR